MPAWAALIQAQQDYPCARIEAAKTEAFLGIHSDSTMSAAIKDSESADPNKRILAAVIFSYLGTQEAEQDLKTLSNDADPRVAHIAKEAPPPGEDPRPARRTIHRGGNYSGLSELR
jgi:HEAT repeat protein